MRLFVSFALLLFLSLASQPPSPTPTVGTQGSKNKGSLKNQNAAPDDQVSRDLVTAINQLAAAIETWEQSEQSVKTHPEPGTNWIMIFTGALVLVAALQFWAMHRQANISNKLAEIADEQRKIQATALQQWVNLDQWEVSPSSTPRTYNISFQIVNATQVPLTLHTVHVNIEGKGTTEDVANVLAPKNPYVASMSHELSESGQDEYVAGSVAIGVQVQVFFADCFGIHWEQTFGRILLFGPTQKVDTMIMRNLLRKSGVAGSEQTPTPLWRRAVDWWVIQVEAMKKGESENE